MAQQRSTTVAIVGLGLIGGSLAYSWKSSGYFKHVLALARRQETIDQAVAAGAIDAGYTTAGPWLRRVDALVLATPVGQILNVLDDCLPYLSPDCKITDVGSVKQPIVAGAAERNSGKLRFLGGHPMTGSEQSGFAAARDGLFRNATYIFTPTKETRADDVDYWRHAAEVIGANVVIMDPQVHDRIVAWTSQLPFIVASALTRSVLHSEIDNSMLRPLIAGGFRDTTRVASGEPRMSADMCSFNHKELLESLRQFRSALSKLETLLQQCEANNEPLFEELKRIKNGRDRLLEG